MSKEHVRHARKYDGHKAAMRRAAQGQNAEGLFARARRQVGNTGPVLHPSFVAGRTRSVGGYFDTRARSVPVAADSGPARDKCDACGKSVRLKKDGSLYAHKCVDNS